MKIHRLIFGFLILSSIAANAVDLRQYFPASGTVLLNNASGTQNSRYTFTSSPSGFQPLYNQFYDLNKTGYLYSWQKEYWVNNAWCTSTYAMLFMGDDLSVTEAGDWYASTPCTPNTAFGYKTTAGVNAGLVWAPAGGVLNTPTVNEMDVWNQATPGAAYANTGYQAYSKSGLVESLATYAPPYGRNASGVWGAGNAATYSDVIHIVMYHGTKNASTVPVRCDTPPLSAQGAYYQSFKNYNSYAIELWLAKGIGIIQENTTFIEDGSYWSVPNCNGGVFSPPFTWSTFIDN